MCGGLNARLKLRAPDLRARFEHADIGNVDFGAADMVLLLDVLHYLDLDSQRQVLERARDCLLPAGTLLLRVADARWHTLRQPAADVPHRCGHAPAIVPPFQYRYLGKTPLS